MIKIVDSFKKEILNSFGSDTANEIPESLNPLLLAAQYVPHLRGQVPSTDDLKAISSEFGISAALEVFYRALLNSNLHGPFIRYIHAQKHIAPPLSKLEIDKERIEVVFIPSEYPLEESIRFKTVIRGPQWGEWITWMRPVVRNLGFATEIIPTLAENSIGRNAEVIAHYFQRVAPSNVIVVTVGRGSAEMRAFLQRRGPSALEMSRVKGWVNINGAFRGARIFDERLQGTAARSIMRTLCRVRKESFLACQELSRDFHYYSKPLEVSAETLIVSLIGLPRVSSLPMAHRSDYDLLRSWGPNNGRILLADGLARPGFAYPIPGMSANCERGLLEPVLVRTLNAIRATLMRTLGKNQAPAPELSL